MWVIMDGSEKSDWGKPGPGHSRGPSDRAASADNFRWLTYDRIGGGSRAVSNGTECLPTEKACPPCSTGNLQNQMDSSRLSGNELVDLEDHILEPGEVSLRRWLDELDHPFDRSERMHIFRQIVGTVNLAHSQGIVVHNVRPSCFIMSSFNKVSFIESASCSSSESDSMLDGVDRKNKKRKSASLFADDFSRHRIIAEDKDFQTEASPTARRALEASCIRTGSTLATNLSSIGENEEKKLGELSNAGGGVRKATFPLKQILQMELKWYTSPEESAGNSSSFASDIYRLGVLLFELFCTFSSLEEKFRSMSNLRHRILPPQLLMNWPKEASFCQWLLHPQPNARAKMSEVLQYELLNEPRDTLEQREAAIKLKEEIEEQELLLEFLLQLHMKKQETSDKLHGIVSFLSSDIEEVQKQQAFVKKKGDSFEEFNNEDNSSLMRLDSPLKSSIKDESSNSFESNKLRQCRIRSNAQDEFSEQSNEGQMAEKNQQSILSKSSRLMKNFKKLESAYFATRKVPGRRQLHGNSSDGSVGGRVSVKQIEGSSFNSLVTEEDHLEGGKCGWINPFLEGLCKYLSFSKLKVRAELKQGDLVNSSNLVCSLGFDRDKEFFATAGVNRKIKIFECDAILNEDRDIHYPVTEMVNRSRLSSISWNGYIKSQIASSDFDGVVQVWDTTRGQVYMEMREHERRVWSVDFSQADPKRLASGSDDGAIKLWNINQERSVGTIRTKANICCVQFHPDCAYSLAIGSADHKIYCFDHRNVKVPWCTFNGHSKTVSYVKFADSTTLVSASTDNSIKLWDLKMNTSQVVNCPIQTFTGHTNVKNFVGLSISNGFIATGSETNEVFVYQKVFPMPVLSFKFNSTDPLSGHELDDSTQFVSSVCWRGQSSTLIAANSTGNIKLLEMV